MIWFIWSSIDFVRNLSVNIKLFDKDAANTPLKGEDWVPLLHGGNQGEEGEAEGKDEGVGAHKDRGAQEGDAAAEAPKKEVEAAV